MFLFSLIIYANLGSMISQTLPFERPRDFCQQSIHLIGWAEIIIYYGSWTSRAAGLTMCAFRTLRVADLSTMPEKVHMQRVHPFGRRDFCEDDVSLICIHLWPYEP
jgi:hypothetical protein